MLRQIVPLSDEHIEVERDELHLATSVPARRLEIRFGKFSLADFFDVNTWGRDSHLQFLNWTVDNDGAWDYAANTRGYTDGALVEYDDHWFSARFGEVLEPKVANGIHLDADIARAHASNLELEAQGSLFAHRRGAVRLLSYLNQANMGHYREAITDYLDGQTSTPDIVATRRQGRHKYGFGLNFEQEITPQVGIFGRLGWDDGSNESFAYTERRRPDARTRRPDPRWFLASTERSGRNRLCCQRDRGGPSAISCARRSRLFARGWRPGLWLGKNLRGVFTPPTSGAASSHRAACSMSTIRVITRSVVR